MHYWSEEVIWRYLSIISSSTDACIMMTVPWHSLANHRAGVPRGRKHLQYYVRRCKHRLRRNSEGVLCLGPYRLIWCNPGRCFPILSPWLALRKELPVSLFVCYFLGKGAWPRFLAGPSRCGPNSLWFVHCSERPLGGLRLLQHGGGKHRRSAFCISDCDRSRRRRMFRHFLRSCPSQGS